MIIYLISFSVSFLFSWLGWFIPSGLVLIVGAFGLYWSDYRKSGNLIHLRALFGLFFTGGQALSCMKLSRLQTEWSHTTWACFFLAVVSFYLAYEWAERRHSSSSAGGWLKRQASGPHGMRRRERELALRRFEKPLFVSIAAVTAVSLAAFLFEAAVLGYIPFFLRGVPHAYSYFHISGVHYFTVSCVLVPSLYVLYAQAQREKNRVRNGLAALLTVVSLLIPVLCVSRFQLILAVGMAAFTFLAVKHKMKVWQTAVLVGAMIPCYVILTIARSHDVAYLNGIFEMKNSAMPIFVTQPYMYIANNYDNFNCLVENLPAHSFGMRMLFPVWALTGLKFLVPELVNFPIYVNKEELTTLTLIYDAYYDFGVPGVILFCGALGLVCCVLVQKLSRLDNPVGYVLYAQIAMYLVLSFFTTWFSNPATWFYLAVTGAVYLYVEYRQRR
ncbi:MAG: O-antigen polymerase [Lachnospiraceae bacterium]|nr:O-antigen polymerase [Lachnospiraceae bacterium]